MSETSEQAAEFKFSPDKDIDGNGRNTNGERSAGARSTLVDYKSHKMETGVAPDADTVQDLISDLGHFCDENGIDFETVVEQAVGRWEEER